MDLILSRDSKKFIKKLDIKQARQIVLKIKALETEARPHDSKKLKGTKIEYYRIDVGEFRIIYEIDDNLIMILLVGKRNDDEVYDKFKRKSN